MIAFSTQSLSIVMSHHFDKEALRQMAMSGYYRVRDKVLEYFNVPIELLKEPAEGTESQNLIMLINEIADYTGIAHSDIEVIIDRLNQE